MVYSSELENYIPDSALSCVRIAYKEALALKNESLQSEAALQFAFCEQKKSNYQVALKYFFLAANLFKKTKNFAGLSKCYTGMGVTYWYQGLHNQAVEYFNRNIELSERMNDEKGLATSYGNLAIIFDEKGELEKSLASYNKALDLFKKNNDQSQIASCYDNMSLIYLQKRDFPNAISFHEKGFAIRKNLSDTMGIIASMENLGTIYIRQKKADKAIEVASQSLLLANRFNSKEDVKYSYITLRDAYEIKGDYKTAYTFQAKLMRLKDSLMQQANVNQIAELEAKFKNQEQGVELNEIKLEQKLKEEQNENINKKKNFAIAILVIGGVSFLLISFLFFKRFKEKQKIANELKEKNDAISSQKIIIDKAYSQLAEINKDLTDSIKYAKRIQEAIFPPANLLSKLLPDSFVLFKPKDIVSGDFYWIEEVGDDVYFAVVDCTGHGVPGAFMSIVGVNLLNKAIHENKCDSPAKILNQLNKDLNETLRQSINESNVKDGMELTLCKWNKKQNKFVFAAANHVMYQISDGNLITHIGNKHPIGGFYEDTLKEFTEQELTIKKGDSFYLISDGYADQFGGPVSHDSVANVIGKFGLGKKFKYKQLETTILGLHKLSPENQKETLNSVFNDWKGDLEQVDDVLVLGLKI